MSVAPGPDNKKRLSEWIDKYERSLLHLCCMYLKDINLAEDAVQEAFLKAYQHMDSFRGESSEKSWLYRIAINVCNDIRRSRWMRMFDRNVDIEKLTIPVEGVSDVSITLMEEIMRLPKKHREVIFLFYYEDMKLAEIAKLLGTPVSTVSDRLHKARELLRKALKGG